MSTYTYRIEESTNPQLMCMYVLMMNGKPLTMTPFRRAAIAWCRRNLAKRRKRK